MLLEPLRPVLGGAGRAESWSCPATRPAGRRPARRRRAAAGAPPGTTQPSIGDHDRRLQPLGSVHRHDPDLARPASRSRFISVAADRSGGGRWRARACRERHGRARSTGTRRGRRRPRTEPGDEAPARLGPSRPAKKPNGPLWRQACASGPAAPRRRAARLAFGGLASQRSHAGTSSPRSAQSE